MSNWQPIETAPKDGTDVIVWCPKESCVTVAWFYMTGWQESIGAPDYMDCPVKPTHWMPFPDPPNV